MFPNPSCNFQQAVSWAVWGRTKEQLHSLALKIIINTRYQVQNFSLLKKNIKHGVFLFNPCTEKTSAQLFNHPFIIVFLLFPFRFILRSFDIFFSFIKHSIFRSDPNPPNLFGASVASYQDPCEALNTLEPYLGYVVLCFSHKSNFGSSQKYLKFTALLYFLTTTSSATL